MVLPLCPYVVTRRDHIQDRALLRALSSIQDSCKEQYAITAACKAIILLPYVKYHDHNTVSGSIALYFLSIPIYSHKSCINA